MPALPQIKLSKTRKDDLRNYLDRQIDRAEASQSSLLSRLRMADDAYDAQPVAKTIPWPGSCSVRIPIIRIIVESLKARYINTVEAAKPFFIVRPRPGQSTANEMARAAEDFMENVTFNDREMDMHRVNSDFMFPLILRGSAMVHVPYETFVQPGITYDENNQPVPFEEVLVDAVRPRYIPAEDFLKPPEALDVQTSPWIGYIVRRTRAEILLRERAGHWRSGTFRDVKSHQADDPVNEGVRAASSRVGISSQDSGPADGSENDLTDLWKFHVILARYDILGDGRALPVVIVYHRPTRTLARVVFNWYWHQQREFVRFRFTHDAQRWDTPGIGHRLIPMSRALDTAFQQSIDNASLANMRLWAYKLGEPAIKKNMRMWPGRMIGLTDTANGLVPKQMGDIYPSGFAIQQALQTFINQDSAMGDIRFGDTSGLKSAVPATSTLATIQEGNTRLDTGIKDLRSGYGKLGSMALSCYQQFNPTGKIFSYLDQEQGALVDQLFRLPREAIRDRVAIELSASSAQMNRDIERQNNIAIMQVASGYYEKTIALMQLVTQAAQQFGPGSTEPLLKMMDKTGEIFAQTLDSFEVRDARQFVISGREFITALSQGSTPTSATSGVVGPVAGVPVVGQGSPPA